MLLTEAVAASDVDVQTVSVTTKNPPRLAGQSIGSRLPAMPTRTSREQKYHLSDETANTTGLLLSAGGVGPRFPSLH